MFSPGELADLMDARLVIEQVTALRACERATPELNKALEQAIMDLRNAPRGASFAEFRDSWEADERFHRLIAENGAKQFILAAYHALGGQIQRFRFLGGPRGPRSGADVGREVLAGEGEAGADEVGGCALEDDPAAVVAGAGPEVDDPVGVRHDRLVVRDDDDRLAGVDEPVEQCSSCSTSARWRPVVGSSRT